MADLAHRPEEEYAALVIVQEIFLLSFRPSPGVIQQEVQEVGHVIGILQICMTSSGSLAKKVLQIKECCKEMM